jgi:hypothetical protein
LPKTDLSAKDKTFLDDYILIYKPEIGLLIVWELLDELAIVKNHKFKDSQNHTPESTENPLIIK